MCPLVAVVEVELGTASLEVAVCAASLTSMHIQKLTQMNTNLNSLYRNFITANKIWLTNSDRTWVQAYKLHNNGSVAMIMSIIEVYTCGVEIVCGRRRCGCPFLCSSS